MTLLDVPRVSRKLPPEVYTADEVQRLIFACSIKAKTGVRNRALLVLLYRSGLRLSEALGLRPKDLDRSGCSLRVLHGKGDKARTVGMDADAFKVVETWLGIRDTLAIDPTSPLFCTLQGARIKTAYIRALLPRLAERSGIAKRIHAHGFRHSHACELASEGVELRVISAQLGHSNVSTTDTYLRHLSPTAVIEAIRARTSNLEECNGYRPASTEPIRVHRSARSRRAAAGPHRRR